MILSVGEKVIFVEFKDLPYFDFPEKKPDCFNVMIVDNLRIEDIYCNELKPSGPLKTCQICVKKLVKEIEILEAK